MHAPGQHHNPSSACIASYRPHTPAGLLWQSKVSTKWLRRGCKPSHASFSGGQPFQPAQTTLPPMHACACRLTCAPTCKPCTFLKRLGTVHSIWAQHRQIGTTRHSRVAVATCLLRCRIPHRFHTRQIAALHFAVLAGWHRRILTRVALLRLLASHSVWRDTNHLLLVLFAVASAGFDVLLDLCLHTEACDHASCLQA